MTRLGGALRGPANGPGLHPWDRKTSVLPDLLRVMV